MATFYERNKQVIQCGLGALAGGMVLGAILMYARTAIGKRMRKAVKKTYRKKMPKFSDLYANDSDIATPDVFLGTATPTTTTTTPATATKVPTFEELAKKHTEILEGVKKVEQERRAIL